ncbi:hypothetical protein F2Q69_00028787 [Brassica cretica]|uniref:Uncharacterized protein n=1 Tax=Brassica cretica TaxID=69181 RepID=A0A8S9RVU8_BRACR|nr:hypothetical protein F2Q69_00028787 [Brassica cretica]
MRLLREDTQRLLLRFAYILPFLLLFSSRFSLINTLDSGFSRTMTKRSASSTPTMADRAGSRRRVDSPISRSDSSPDPGEGSKYDLMAPLPLARKYSLPPFVDLHVPTSKEHASSYVSGEIAIYEAFFDTGFRGVIPVLIASLCGFFEISPSQLNPPSWRLLVAIQNLGDLENLSFWINKVLFSYNLAPLNGEEGRFHLRPRSGLPIVEELPKSDPGTHPALPEGESTVLRARQLPLDRRQVNFLFSNSVLRRSSLWGNMSGGTVNDPFAAYQEAAKVISAKKGSAGRGSASGMTSGDDVVITGSRQVVTVKMEPPSLAQTKKPKSGGMATRSLQQSAEAMCSVGSLATALSNLNLQVFPQDGTVLPPGEPSEVVHTLQWGLLRCLVKRNSRRQASEERAQRLAREMEIRDLKDNVKDLERSAKVSSADALAAGKRNSELEEAMGTLKLEMVMAVNGARVIARWELMREWLKEQSTQWDLAKALEQYKAVTLEEAKNKNAPLPTFEDEPAIPPVSRRPGGLQNDLGVMGFPGTLGLLNSWLVPYALDPRSTWGTDGFRTRRNLWVFRNLWVLDLEAFMSPEFYLRTRNISFKGPYSAILGEATIGTCWDFVFCRSEPGHYRVSVLHAVISLKLP